MPTLRGDRRALIRWSCLGYLAGVWLGALFQIEAFPVTWAPMYSGYMPKDTISAPDRSQGPGHLWVKHRDGREDQLRRRQLNLAPRDWRKLVEKRVFQAARAARRGGKRSRRHDGLGRWFHALMGSDERAVRDGDRRLLCALNRTLGRTPLDSDFIVAVRANRTRHLFDRRTLDDLGREPMVASVRWRVGWNQACP